MVIVGHGVAAAPEGKRIIRSLKEPARLKKTKLRLNRKAVIACDKREIACDKREAFAQGSQSNEAIQTFAGNTGLLRLRSR
jgi:hypothetical protein